MKSLTAFIFLALLTDGYSQTETPEQSLAKLEDKRLKAVIARDSVTFLSLYDERYRGVLTSGRPVDRAGVVEFQMTHNPYIKISIEGVVATVHGDVGIVTGKQVNRSKAGNVLGQSKFIRVYKKSGNTWKILYSQGTVVAEDE